MSTTGAGGAGDDFDQTNALAGDTAGESDGTLDGERVSAGERSSDADSDAGRPGDDDDLELDGRDRLGGSDPEGPAILPRLLGEDNEV
jgi:hypothetical protein